MTFTLLSSKEAKMFRKSIEERWGVDIPREHSFFKSTSGKIFAITKDASKVDISKFRVSSIGLYIADDTYGLRLSIEGAQMYCKNAKKNITEITLEQQKEWLQGKDIKGTKEEGWTIIKCGKDIMGCGLAKNGTIKNYYPKARRIP